MELPFRDWRLLGCWRVRLAPENHALPSGSQPAAGAGRIVAALKSLQNEAPAADLRPLIDSAAQLPPCRTLAEQVGAWTAGLMAPWADAAPLLFATQLNLLPSFDGLVRRMVDDARACVAAYNRAVGRHPAARVAPLAESLDRAELPLWARGWEQPRLKVFADLSDTRPALALESGEIIDLHGLPSARTRRGGLQLAPKALFMTALLRRSCCDLFIHGKGGGVYDAITESWWRDWMGEELAPMAVVSADLYLPFDVPVATPGDLAKARWYSHHLPHNLDRVLSLHDAGAARKRVLLEQMNRDDNRARRAAAFAELHAINARLAADHPEAIHAAAGRLEETEIGVLNHGLARKRDWCFALYPPAQLDALRDEIAALQ
jgi:hypothetical protein